VLDAVDFESRGLPAAAVITEPFVGACKAMARLRGFEDYPLVVAPHPVTSLDLAGAEALAYALTDAIEARLTHPTAGLDL
jgi:hypothetical protein